MSELTRLGRFLRKLRIDRSELLKDMAKRLGVTVSFLSAVENGKKSMPSDWVAKLSMEYEFSSEQKHELDDAVAESEKGIAVKFDGMSQECRQLSVAFARKISSLTVDEQIQLQSILI